jgi:hypothetical protein
MITNKVIGTFSTGKHHEFVLIYSTHTYMYTSPQKDMELAIIGTIGGYLSSVLLCLVRVRVILSFSSLSVLLVSFNLSCVSSKHGFSYEPLAARHVGHLVSI